MIKELLQSLLSMYSYRYPTVLAYMLQNTEYEIGPYISWVNRTRNFNTVIRRRQLNPTRRARMIVRGIRIGIVSQLLGGILLIVLGLTHHFVGGSYFGLAIIVCYPLVWPYLIPLPLLLISYGYAKPRDKERVAASRRLFESHPGIKIAVAGSYGKTTMKELLAGVLSEGKRVAATPANKNVAVSHAAFAEKLTGQEDILIIEYGEGGPGDISRFAKISQPDYGIITGIAPAHLNRYKTLDAAAKDIFSLAQFVDKDQFYVDSSSSAILPYLQPDFQLFNDQGALGWQVTNPQIGLTGTSFRLTHNKQSINFHSGLVGRHQLAFLAFVAALSLHLGLSQKQVQAGIAKTVPFEHRMKPYSLNGAWVIDDTYNGNLEGIRVGTSLLAELTASRKIYVTPGLVDQGAENESIHNEVGELIAGAHPDIVVLMQNSVTDFIRSGLTKAQYKGELRIENNPLLFYTNLNQIVASGDLVLMQNDWPDNYA